MHCAPARSLCSTTLPRPGVRGAGQSAEIDTTHPAVISYHWSSLVERSKSGRHHWSCSEMAEIHVRMRASSCGSSLSR
eukprot:scaffold39397_cov60-Phaeocystis_antarctica.AAC.3